MSLTSVTPSLVQKIAQGYTLKDEEFISEIKASFPKAWSIIETLISDLQERDKTSAIFSPPTLDDTIRGHLLRIMASTSIRTTIERHYGIRLAFQNCHAVGTFPLTPEGQEEYEKFTSPEAQIIAQSPELRDC